MAGDLFNQAPNTPKTIRALNNVEFIVGQDHFLTPTVRYADIVLPATTFWERNDVHTPWAGAGHYAIFMKQAIEPMYECRNDIEILADLAKRVGIEGYNNKSDLEWLKEFTADRVDDFEAFMKAGVARFPGPEDAVAFAKEIRDPENHKFSTPSGKIEIYSTNLGEARSVRSWRDFLHPEMGAAYRYERRLPTQPAQLEIRARTHSIHGNQKKLNRVDPDDVWMHPDDAVTRGIQNGQPVQVESPYGATILPVRVTQDIARGCVSKEGRWYTPDADGVDREGATNSVTRDFSAACGATTYNTAFVEVRPVNPRPM